jgi:hypothetical protein
MLCFPRIQSSHHQAFLEKKMEKKMEREAVIDNQTKRRLGLKEVDQLDFHGRTIKEGTKGFSVEQRR